MQSRIRAAFALIVLTLASVAIGAAAGERLKDYVIIGLGTSSDKVLEFDAGAGGSNAKLTATSSGTLASSGNLLGASGSAAAPGFAFSADTDTGAYRVGANNLGLATAGTLRLDLSTSALTSTLPYLGSAGSAAAPSLSFSGDPNTGIYSSGTDEIGLAGNGSARFLIGSQMQSSNPGSDSAPTYTWDGDENTGMYRFAADEIGFTAGGTRQMEMRAGYVRTQVAHAFIDGTAADPGIRFEDDQNTGIYRSGTDQLGITTGGSLNTIFTGSQIQASNGTGANPAFSFSGNTSTGVFLPSSNVLGFATAGAVRASVTSGGLQFYEASSGQGEFKVKVFTGSLASSGTVTLNPPSGILLGASGVTTTGGAGYTPMGVSTSTSPAELSGIIMRQIGILGSDDVRLRNTSGSTESYRVIMFYQ